MIKTCIFIVSSDLKNYWYLMTFSVTVFALTHVNLVCYLAIHKYIRNNFLFLCGDFSWPHASQNISASNLSYHWNYKTELEILHLVVWLGENRSDLIKNETKNYAREYYCYYGVNFFNYCYGHTVSITFDYYK